MRLINPPHPEKGTRAYRFVRFFVDRVNFCEGTFYETGFDKPQNRLYDFFYKYWLFPFRQNDCICCNTVRGLLYGIVVGFALGVLL